MHGTLGATKCQYGFECHGHLSCSQNADYTIHLCRFSQSGLFWMAIWLSMVTDHLLPWPDFMLWLRDNRGRIEVWPCCCTYPFHAPTSPHVLYHLRTLLPTMAACRSCTGFKGRQPWRHNFGSY